MSELDEWIALVDELEAEIQTLRTALDRHVAEAETPEAARDEGMRRADRAMSPEFRTAANRAIWTLAQLRVPFTTDDVWALIDGVWTHERRALGPLMMAAARRGLIIKTGRMVKSRRTEAHANPKAEWVGA